jgi:hypothetical protein
VLAVIAVALVIATFVRAFLSSRRGIGPPRLPGQRAQVLELDEAKPRTTRKAA